MIKDLLNIFRGNYEIILVMYIEPTPNRNSSPALQLRESYREDGKVPT
ncbi:hypothetical protein RintRC_5927 [Richelia intracellularis]|nr:hypothetical protein RintRC_5927 [Richelia intracellularis]